MRFSIQPLEPRRLLSTTTTVLANIAAPPVAIFGSSKNDRIHVEPSPFAGEVYVYVNGKLTQTLAKEITIYGGRGDDTIAINLGEDPRYADLNIIIHGGGGNDWISGAISAERIIAGDGNDSVSGNGGRDTIYGEGGDDSLRGGGSSDLLDGGDGRDTLRGDAGNDNISGGGDTDRLRGSLGDDTLRGGASKDFIGGEDGKDWLEGNGGADVLAGGDGNDYVNGGPGDDHCEGNAGNDVMAGWSGVDFLFGGPDGDAIQSPDEWHETRDFGAGDWNPIDNGPGGDGIVINVSGTGAVTRAHQPVSGTTTVKLDDRPRLPGGVIDILLLP
jgi:Ca2+-binding RTX toxin-like protein